MTNRRSEPNEHWTKVHRSMMEQPAWRALSSRAQNLYYWLKLEWKGPKFNNNGKIRLSIRQAAHCMGCGVSAAARAFHDLQAKGFIVVTEKAHLGIGGAAKSPAFQITELGMIGSNSPDGEKKYRHWTSGHDFEVHKSAANNPKGRNGKTESHHQNHDILISTIYPKVFSTSVPPLNGGPTIWDQIHMAGGLLFLSDHYQQQHRHQSCTQSFNSLSDLNSAFLSSRALQTNPLVRQAQHEWLYMRSTKMDLAVEQSSPLEMTIIDLNVTFVQFF